MPNDSSTGGYLVPSTRGGEQNDESLRIFLQQLVAGVTGIDGTLVFPRWQAEPPIRPAISTDWAAVGVQKHRPDLFPYVVHEGSGDGDDLLYRNELLDILCTFYGPNCESNSELLSIGLMIAQNREVLQLAGFGVVDVEEPTTLADLIHEQWVTRVDVPFCLSRAQEYKYPVLTIVGATVSAQDDTLGVNTSIQVTPGTMTPGLPLFGWGLQSGLVQGWGKGRWL